MVIAQTAIGLLRQQLQPATASTASSPSGGEAPNIIPAHTDAPLHDPRRDRANAWSS